MNTSTTATSPRRRRFGLLALGLALALSLARAAFAADGGYEATVATWSRPADVATWLQGNFVFDRARQAQASAQLRSVGTQGALTRRPEALFSQPRGYCRDAAALARDALNRINPSHQARYIFIRNRLGPPNHWVTGYWVDQRLYVMDFGTGPDWRALEGVHGPYDSLDDYRAFLARLEVTGFAPELVVWRDVPGQAD